MATLNASKSGENKMAQAKSQTQPTVEVEEITIEAHWLQRRRRYTATALAFIDEGNGVVRVEYAQTNIDFLKGKEHINFSYDYRAEEVKRPHAKAEKFYEEQEDGSLWLPNGELLMDVEMTLPAIPCAIVRKTMRKSGYDHYVEDTDVEVNSEEAMNALLDKTYEIYPKNKWELWNLRDWLYHAGFRYDKNRGGYFRIGY
jgi:hypothetical protein